MSRALATAGSAVVFAGTTVIIALTGLAVARIPVLTVMGLAAAAAVAVAVVVALTLLPAIALLLGERLRTATARRCGGGLGAGKAGDPCRQHGRRSRAVGCTLSPARPVLTIAAVVAILLLAALPADQPGARTPRQQLRAGGHPAAADLRRHHRRLRGGLQRAPDGDRRGDHQQRPGRHRQQAGQGARAAARGRGHHPGNPERERRHRSDPSDPRCAAKRHRRPLAWSASCATTARSWRRSTA